MSQGFAHFSDVVFFSCGWLSRLTQDGLQGNIQWKPFFQIFVLGKKQQSNLWRFWGNFSKQPVFKRMSDLIIETTIYKWIVYVPGSEGVFRDFCLNNLQRSDNFGVYLFGPKRSDHNFPQAPFLLAIPVSGSLFRRSLPRERFLFLPAST